MIRTRVKESVTQGLCGSCKWHVRVVFGNGEEWHRCSSLERYLHDVVNYCDLHTRLDDMSIWDAKQIAWLLDTNKKGQIGFIKPQDLSDKRKNELWSEVKE